MILSDFWLLATCCLPPLCCQLVWGIDWPVNPLIQVDSNHCLKKNMWTHSKHVSYCFTCWHALPSGCLGHGFRIRPTWQHGFLKTKQITWVYAQNCCFGCSNGQITENWISTSKNFGGLLPHSGWLLSTWILKNDQARHGLGMDYIVQSKLPN